MGTLFLIFGYLFAGILISIFLSVEGDNLFPTTNQKQQILFYLIILSIVPPYFTYMGFKSLLIIVDKIFETFFEKVYNWCEKKILN
jgi:hypothetical protein